ncbi:MAG: S8 family serine peptidase, partial [Clostridia bacterium]|nr:S8 family serine peptidase [Clostridia bacterium]
MKNARPLKRFLSVVMTVAMLAGLMVPLASAAEPAGTAGSEKLSLTRIDASSLSDRKLGELNGKEEEIPEETHSPGEIVRVSIALDKESTIAAGYDIENIANNAAAMAYRGELKSYQQAMTRKIESAIGKKLDVKWNITLAGDFISANVKYGDLDAIRKVPGVVSAELENRYELNDERGGDDVNTVPSSAQIGSSSAWAAGYTGAGSKVAVIDTGIDKEHISFDGGALIYSLSKIAEEKGISADEYIASLDLLDAGKVAEVASELNVSVDPASAYVNEKIPFAYNYVDENYDVVHVNDRQSEHGTHVSGIAAANKYIEADGGYALAIEKVAAQGVAPDAQIVTMKVFGTGGGAYDSDYMVAIEDAIVLGCDSCNLSLGSGSLGFGFSGGYEDVMDLLVEKGMVVAMSAGNSGHWYDSPLNESLYPGYIYADDNRFGTDGSPGSFHNSLCVASVDNIGQTGMPLMFGDLAVFYNESSYSNEPITTLAPLGELEYVAIDGYGSEEDFAALAEVLPGKVAMCSRGGDISFYLKAEAAVKYGAVATIIYNNSPEMIGMDLSSYTKTQPCVLISDTDGAAIKEQSEVVELDNGAVYYTGTMSVSENLSVFMGEPSDYQTVSSFSSYGIPESLTMKPEITAPGGSIYSTQGLFRNEQGVLTGSHDGYELMSGTSMASPQVAGMAALVAQYVRESGLCEQTGLSARQLTNSLLMSTAHPVFDEYGDYWPVIRVGAGLANVGDAVSAKAYILMGEDSTMMPDSARDGKVKAELGDDPERTGEYNYSFTVTPLGEGGEYTFRTDIFTQYITTDGQYFFHETYPLLLPVDVSYEIDGVVYSSYIPFDADVNLDGTTDAADAQAILDSLTGKLGDDAEFDGEAADVDGDGDITSYDAHLILSSLTVPAVPVNGPTTVNVSIRLDDEAKAFLNVYYDGGAYIEGYTYVEPYSTDEGAITDVTYSIPILAYYGSWTDASMFDRSSYIDELYDTGRLPYIDNPNTNYMTVQYGDSDANVFIGNPYAVEEKFPADRLALSDSATVKAFNFLPIRNIGTYGAAILDESGKPVWISSLSGGRTGAFYHVNEAKWMNISPVNFNVGKLIGSLGFEEGSEFTVAFFALPEYYTIMREKAAGGVATGYQLTAEGFKDILETGYVGDGASIAYTFTLDNTAPEVTGAARDLITGDVTVKAIDNNNVAFIALLNRNGTKLYAGGVPEQNGVGEETELFLKIGGEKLPNEVVLLAADYAGNETAYLVELGGEQEDFGGRMFGFAPGENGSDLLSIDPDELYYAGVDDFGGKDVYSDVGIRVEAAEYVEGYVFMAADDGWLYVAPFDSLDEVSPVAPYYGYTDKIFDMAFNYRNHKLYSLGTDNVIYETDVLTGVLTPVFRVLLNGASENYAAINTLAVDDLGTFYVVSYGAPSRAMLYSFTPEYVVEEEESEVNCVAEWDFESADELSDWTLLDNDGDGSRFVYYSAGTSAFNGNGVLCSRWNSNASVDDWAITPAIDLSGVEDATLSVQVRKNSPNFEEHYAIYAGLTSDPDDMIEIVPESVANYDWNEVTVPLTDYAGEAEIYVALRHFDSLDQYNIYFDCLQIIDETVVDEPVVEPGAEEIVLDPIGAVGAWNYSNGGALAWDHDKDVLYLAGNYNSTSDTDHVLWTVNTSTGRGTRTGPSDAINPGRFNDCLNGLFIVPGGASLIVPTDTAADVHVVPYSIELLRGMTAKVTAVVSPWTLTDKSVTWSSNDESVVTVTQDGIITAVSEGYTTVTATTVAEPNLTADVEVYVKEAPATEMKGILYGADGKGYAVSLDSSAPAEWTALGTVGTGYNAGGRVEDIIYTIDDGNMYGVDADTYEVSSLGVIVSDWQFTDAAELPDDLGEAWEVSGRLIGPCSGGTYLEIINPEAGSLVYFDLTDDFSEDPMVTIAYVGRTVDDGSALYYVMTESGALYEFKLDFEGELDMELLGETGISLEGISMLNDNHASMLYSEETDFLYLALYDGNGKTADLYAIDPYVPARNAIIDNFGDDVWPVISLYDYEPATDLVLKVRPDELTLFEAMTAQINAKVKLGDTNEVTFTSSDPDVATVDETGLVTAVAEGEAVIRVETVDVNDLGEHLFFEIPVVVKGYVSIDATVVAQVSDDRGSNFVELSLTDLSSDVIAEAPGDIDSGARTGEVYLAALESGISALDPETFVESTVGFTYDASLYADYPPIDIANYPYHLKSTGVYNTARALFTTSIGWLVDPDYTGWNLSSYIPKMAGVAYCGTFEEDGANYFSYYVIDTDGVLYYVDVNYAEGTISLGQMLDTGIMFEDPGDASMAFIETDDTAGLVVANNGDKTVWFIDFSSGEVGVVGFLDAENVTGLVGTYDDVVTVDEKPDDPFEGAEPSIGFYFEEDPAEEGWTFVDYDEDENNWIWTPGSGYSISAYEGEGAIISQSFINNVGPL